MSVSNKWEGNRLRSFGLAYYDEGKRQVSDGDPCQNLQMAVLADTCPAVLETGYG